ncbi:MAG: hypothetical protein ACM3SY_10530 [Candidatus Omnitrophota bacterium]
MSDEIKNLFSPIELIEATVQNPDEPGYTCNLGYVCKTGSINV